MTKTVAALRAIAEAAERVCLVWRPGPGAEPAVRDLVDAITAWKALEVALPLERRAERFATEAHARAGQVRKYTGAPYIEHPRAVVAIVRSVPHDEAMLAAAWLHDTVEDTGVSIDEIAREFGDDVARLVSDLTDISKPSDGSRKARKAVDRQHTACASARAKTVKLADLIDNSSSIVARDPEFAKVYLEEKRLLLEVLREGDAALWDAAHEFLAVPLSR